MNGETTFCSLFNLFSLKKSEIEYLLSHLETLSMSSFPYAYSPSGSPYSTKFICLANYDPNGCADVLLI